MKLSIILPTYNQEKLLGRCLDSLLNQQLDSREYEIIIVNDESKDNTLEVARSYESRYPNVKVIDRKNGGAGAARNTGMDAAEGDYLHFVDPDDYVTEDCYRHLIALTDTLHPEILCFEHKKTKEGNDVIPLNPYQLSLKDYQIFSGPEYIATHKYHNEVWWYLIRKDFILSKGIRFIEGKWMEDVILTPTLFLQVEKLVKTNLDVYRHVIMPNSAMTRKEPSHYNKLIKDIEDATYVFNDLINSIPEDNATSIACRKRIKTKQQSLVFFMLVRLMKSNLPINTISPKLNGFKNIKAYPLDQFVGEDYQGAGYSILTLIFNNEKVMYPFMKVFRSVYRPALKIYALL
ncbi:glycosyltransferase [Robertkochia flava]|uniref:glycosyltransferase n=1 Tax=Robertkochia flava TaxID=3447986 RepID=UPI001CCB8944|nr:glycosyltransferase [Robertkochia marina]